MESDAIFLKHHLVAAEGRAKFFASSAVSNSPSEGDASLMQHFVMTGSVFKLLHPLKFGIDTGKSSRAARN